MLVYAIMRLKPHATIDDVRAHTVEEARAVWSQIAAATFRKGSIATDRPGAVIEIEATSLSEAEAAMAKLPLVRNGLVEIDLIPVGAYRQLESLFTA